MSWFSILPANLNLLETWLIRIFVPAPPLPLLSPSHTNITPTHTKLILGITTIGPWLLVLIYDLLLYIVRALAYQVPYLGGKARGKRRPRAPSLAERANGRARTFSFGNANGGGGDKEKEGEWQ